jgi:predicted RecB family endonuclease
VRFVGKRRRGRPLRSSEALASRILEEMGYTIVGYHVPVIVDGVEVSDVDIVAEKDGKRYAVEVKAGAIDVSGLRQAYVNAILTNMKPLVVARGYSGEEAEVLAKRLNIEVVIVPDAVMASSDDLREIVREAVADALTEVLGRLIDCPQLSEEEWSLVEAIASGGVAGAAEKLGQPVEAVAKAVASLRKRGALQWSGGRSLILEARLLVLCRKFEIPWVKRYTRSS